ncbi:MAG: UDP-N-acetylmuramate dehydrogenase [Candidatus Omnitrophota bacterium]
MSWQKALEKIIKGRAVLNEPLSRHTTFKIGGRCDCWVEPQDRIDLKRALSFAQEKRQPVFIIGKGSNLLVKDKGWRGMVISLSRPYFKRIEFVDEGMRVGAGLSLAALINLTQREGLSGCEFLSGIPGTVGGAVFMNAGVRGDGLDTNRYMCIGDIVEEVKAMRLDGREALLRKRDLKFAYRSSNLKDFIITAVRLRLCLKKPEAIRCRIERLWQRKKLQQEFSRPSAGCVFRNPRASLVSAGQLIDLCGLKGLSCGQAMVSRTHANFIVNNGHAKAADVLKLIEVIREKVKKKFCLDLIPEIKIIGD